jgi:hypothetical protein
MLITGFPTAWQSRSRKQRFNSVHQSEHYSYSDHSGLLSIQSQCMVGRLVAFKAVN